MQHFALAAVLVLVGCSSSSSVGSVPEDGSPPDGSTGDAAGTDASLPGDGGQTSPLGMVTNVTDVTCPGGAPAGSTCKQLTVTGCPGIESESIDATVAIVAAQGTVTGTVAHFAGGGGEGFETSGASQYTTAGFRQVFVAWKTDWEQTTVGIKQGGCRPATVLGWIWSEPTLHNASRTTGFCGQGFSGGSGQLGYALAQYGLGDYLDYVNELSGPPFARIDLGCNGDAPATATVCGATDTMALPSFVSKWENIQAPLTCGSKNVPAAELLRWKNDSITTGGVYAYPKTDVEFFDCTYNATAVTAMAQIYETLIAQAEGSGGLVGYHCFSQADGCSGEGLGSGGMQAINSMVSGCKPRH